MITSIEDFLVLSILLEIVASLHVLLKVLAKVFTRNRIVTGHGGGDDGVLSSVVVRRGQVEIVVLLEVRA